MQGRKEAKAGTGELAVRAAPRALHILQERHFLKKNSRREHERPQWVPAVTVSLRAVLVVCPQDTLCSPLKSMALHSCKWSRNPSPEHLAAESI